jgi:hypothetical protein
MRLTIYACFMALAFVMTFVCMFRKFGHSPGLNNGNILTIGAALAAALATFHLLMLIERGVRLVCKRIRGSNQPLHK